MNMLVGSIGTGDSQIYPIWLPVVDGLLDSPVEQQRILRVDAQQDVGEVGLMRARRKAEDAEGLLGPIDPVGCEVEFPIADVSQGFNFLEAELTPGRRRFGQLP